LLYRRELHSGWYRENLGWVCAREHGNHAKVRPIFADWYNDANNDEIITLSLRIRLTKGVWNDAHKGIRDEIDFVNQTAETIYRQA
jgi:hypothetical protein